MKVHSTDKQIHVHVPGRYQYWYWNNINITSTGTLARSPHIMADESVIVADCDLSEYGKLDTAIDLLASELTVTTRATKHQMSIMFASVAMSITLRKQCLLSRIPSLMVISKDDKSWYEYLTLKKGAIIWGYNQWM